jgi:hypothetical protein
MIRHPNRPHKHGHNKKACGLCQPHKRHDRKFDDRKRMLRTIQLEIA